MYETYLFRDNREFLKWSEDHVSSSKRAKPMAGWNGAINYVPITDNLYLLYQLEKSDEGWTVVDLHMMLWGADKTLRKDICRVEKFWRPEGSTIWHSSVCYDGRGDIPFVVTNAWMEDAFEKYSEGGNFEMTFAGLGSWMECMNDRGTIRFFDGNPVEMARKERNDPTIDHEDMDASELRSLNSGDDPKSPARAEFTGVIEECEAIRIGGVKCYKILLWSGAPGERDSFPWQLLIADWCIDGKYVPRVGDSVHGNAFMFGTFHGEAQKKPTVFMNRLGLPPCAGDTDAAAAEEIEKDVQNEPTSDEPDGTSADEPEGEGKGWKYLPRKPAEYPEVASHGGGLSPSVRKRFPKYVVYSNYRKAMKGSLKVLKNPGRKELRRIIDSIDYVLTSKKNRHMFASVFESIGVRHFVCDEITGERHLWLCLPSALNHGHFHTNLLIALDAKGDVLRYSLYMGNWDWRRLAGGMSLDRYCAKKKAHQRMPSMASMFKVVPKLEKDDFIIASELGHTSMLQAYCCDIVDGEQRFAVEWQVHHMVWQFRIENASADTVVAMMKEFDKHGIEPVQTMARWKWCKMKCNV